MAQDIRELFKNDKAIPKEGLREGHQKRFEEKMNASFGNQQKAGSSNYLWMKVAAAVVVLLAISSMLFTDPLSVKTTPGDAKTVEVAAADASPLHLSDLSPEFKKLEDYYMASINVELAQLDLTDINKELVDSYMDQLEELNKEYTKLNADLVEVGVNDQTVSTLIDNLQLRLNLLKKLKGKLKDLKVAPEGETQTNRL